MLRPATPLTVLLLAAFVLLLISVISTPIVKTIPLASFDGVDYGVFGYCTGDTCSKIEIGYNFAKSFTASQTGTFDLPTSTRTTLSAILVVHPIAAFFTLIMLILAAAAHFHSPSHSPRYLLGMFILSILTLILSLLSFLVDVLLFIPHMSFGSYLVLAATIIIAISGVVSCAMRRTLVSRKARKRRIEQNAEMNGENFYNRQGTTETITPVTSNPVMSGGAETVDKLPSFATFEMQKTAADQASDERIPLTTRTLSDASNVPRSRGTEYSHSSPPRDQYGNRMGVPPPGSLGMQSEEQFADPSLSRQYSDPAMAGRGAGMPYRGRGGYPPGRGRFGSPPIDRGGYRGGYGGPGRGGYGPAGPYGGPPRNDGMVAGGIMMGGRGPTSGYSRDAYDRAISPPGGSDQYGRRPSGPESETYGRDSSPRPPPVGGYAAYNPAEVRDSLPRAESPPPLPGDGPVGQAIEMDASTGSPSHTPSGFGQLGRLRDSDNDSIGMVGLHPQRQDTLHRDTLGSDASVYSGDESYVPPRQNWIGGASHPNQSSHAVELPVSRNSPSNKRQSSDYYEDVNPRFAGSAALGTPPHDAHRNNTQYLGPGSTDEDTHRARSRSPSERSGFTSVSQRGVNPNWNAGQAGYGQPMPNQRGPPPRANVLNSNPDFEVPGGGRRGKAPSQMTGGGVVPNSAYGGAL